MLQAPTGKSKVRSDTGSTAIVPRQQRAKASYADTERLHSGEPAGDRATSGSESIHQGFDGSHQRFGNQAVLRMLSLSAPRIQAKITVNQPGDVFEQEANRVADQVMRMPDPVAAPNLRSIPSGGARLRRKCASCDEEHRIQRKENSAGPTVAPSTVHDALNSPGQPLETETRAFFEPRFGHDFSQTRLHYDDQAAQSAHDVNALAYTVGHDIVFGTAQYSPASHAGRRLLAHELTHVIQQRQDTPTTARPTAPGQIALISPSMIQRKVDCNLEPINTECAGAAASCQSVKDYCAKKYPGAKELDKLHADAVAGATGYKSDYPNAADNLLHFLGGSGKEKVMNVDIFRNHKTFNEKLTDHLSKFLEGAKKRYDSGALKVGGPAVEMVWTDTANAFSIPYTDLGLAVGGYTLCSKVMAKAIDPKETGGSADYLWIRFDPWTMQAFDCYNWDPGKGIGLPFATDNDFCCLEDAGRSKHFVVRTDPWSVAVSIQNIRTTPEKPSAPPPKAPSKDSKDSDDRR
jgi:Domain of unknown function (DUF4157)